MKGRSFDGLIVCHRKSAVFFERIGDPKNVEMNRPLVKTLVKSDKTNDLELSDWNPYYRREELDVGFEFNIDVQKEFYEYLLQIGDEAWPNFEPQETNKPSAKYSLYEDKDMYEPPCWW